MHVNLNMNMKLITELAQRFLLQTGNKKNNKIFIDFSVDIKIRNVHCEYNFLFLFVYFGVM